MTTTNYPTSQDLIDAIENQMYELAPESALALDCAAALDTLFEGGEVVTIGNRTFAVGA